MWNSNAKEIIKKDTHWVINWLRNNKYIYFICSDWWDKIVMDKWEVNLDKYPNIWYWDVLINNETAGLSYEKSIIEKYKNQIYWLIEKLYHNNKIWKSLI